MITALHGIVYADDPTAARQFFRDVLRWPSVDAHDGWLIFRTGPSEIGVHPTAGIAGDGKEWRAPVHHEISLMCGDIETTVKELRQRGAHFSSEITDQGFGRTVSISVPGAGDILLYEPRHVTAFDL